jgi:hypothetical protein
MGNIKEAVYILFSLKTIVDPMDRLKTIIEENKRQYDEEKSSINSIEKEDFFNQLNPDLATGVFDWHREFVYTTMEIDCEVRNVAIKMMKKKRSSGKNMDDSDSISDDSEEEKHGHNCCGDDDHRGGRHNSHKNHEQVVHINTTNPTYNRKY